jgi:carbon monoxide dehydrogenase subunit G
MEIEQSFAVPYPREAVWASFHDTPGIVACLPGASLSAPPDGNRLKLAMTVKLGPIVASFAGDGEMTLDDAAWRGSVSGGGVDRKSASRVKGEASFSLDGSVPGETRVDVKVDYSIAGSLAQFSRGGIVKELATRMTDAFASNLKARLDQQGLQAVAPAPTSEPESALSSAALTEPAAMDAVAPPALAEQPAPPAEITSARAPDPSFVPPANAPLNLGGMFWKILWSRLCSTFGFGARR